MDFLERLVKECVLFGEQPAGIEGDKADMDDSDDDLFGSATRGYTPRISVTELTLVLTMPVVPKPAPIPNILLHLIHPLGCGTLRNTLPHIRSFRAFLGRHLTNEVLQIADDVLIDMIERSGIDLIKLEPLIAQQYEDIQNLPGDCRPVVLNYTDH